MRINKLTYLFAFISMASSGYAKMNCSNVNRKSYMINLIKNFVILIPIIILTSCGGSSITTEDRYSIDHSVSGIAIGSSGKLATEIGHKLIKEGFRIFYPTPITGLRFDKVDSLPINSLSDLKEKGIDLYLIIQCGVGRDDNPESAVIKAYSPHSGRLITHVNWKTGWGGLKGSGMDQIMRSGFSSAAEEIVNELCRKLK